MKKYLFPLVTIVATFVANAQEVNDALRYSQDNLTGTARFRAMSGAFGALGGDFSSLNVNPAGGAIFTTNQMAVTLSSINTKNKSDFFGTKTEDRENAFDLNQLGAIWVFENRNLESNWKKFSVGINYENANNFDNRQFSAGLNPQNSIANYFLNYANGIPLQNITGTPFEAMTFAEQQAYFGYNGFLINPSTNVGNNTAYVSNVPAGGNYFQENTVFESGYNGKISFNGAFQYTDKFYFGLNLNAHFTDYTRRTSFYEDYLDTPGSSPTTGVQSLRFNNELYTYGSGFSFQLGAIAKVTDELRLGLAYQSPTWMTLFDEGYQNIVVDCADCGAGIIDPGTIIIYPEYRLQTPGEYTGSFAYVFGDKGLISVDYTMKDYSSAKFRPNDSFFNTRNNEIESILDATSELRVGAEARAKQWSFRGGYRFEQSPYKNGRTVGDLHGFSAGLGYDFGGTRLDLAYAYSKRDFNQGFFSQGLVDAPTIEAINNNVSLTLLFSL
ncbi:transporter [Flavobacterium sp. NST-5]|uniref:Transporter n=1 Tax=Flavobacterium ichthyis TaxID=2698827 RepID=A0ABW9ZBJ4_9FLAO|nr:outer membrane protein transport protein [Flavobacterium ichthyis]NBL65902.1 transporter [Flavobacterium ichthyis]